MLTALGAVRVMEFFSPDFGRIACDMRHIVKIDNSLLPVQGHRRKYSDDSALRKIVSDVVDDMGRASAVAQELKSPITSAEKLSRSDHAVYLMTEKISRDCFIAVGLLKMGWKNLYLFEKNGSRSVDEAIPVYCLLDFYTHETRQRRGYGVKLVKYMLNDNKTQARRLAVDQPTYQLLRFLRKHFGLYKLVDQGNKFTIFEEFFENDTGSGVRDDTSSMGFGTQAIKRRLHGTARQHDREAYIGKKKTTKNQTNENGFELSHVDLQEFVDWKQILDRHLLNYFHPKLDLKYFHTPLW